MRRPRLVLVHGSLVGGRATWREQRRAILKERHRQTCDLLQCAFVVRQFGKGRASVSQEARGLLGPLAGGVFGGLGGGLGGGAIAAPIIAPIAVPVLTPLFIVGWLGGFYGLTRTVYKRAAKRRAQALQSLFELLEGEIAKTLKS